MIRDDYVRREAHSRQRILHRRKTEATEIKHLETHSLEKPIRSVLSIPCRNFSIRGRYITLCIHMALTAYHDGATSAR